MTLSIIYNASLCAGYLNELALLVCSLIFCLRRNKPVYVKIFPIYAIICTIPDIFEFLSPSRQYPIYMIFSMFELAYFTYFFTLIYYNKNAAKLLWGLSLLWILRGTMRLISLPDVNKANLSMVSQQYIGECIILIGGCLFYIREIMAKPTIPVLSKEPAFWMVSGLFCYLIVTATSLLFTNFAISHHLPDIGKAVYSINNFCQLFIATLFIIGMTCKKAH
jgi:hypothetical protein